MSLQSRCLLHEPVLLFAFLSRQRSPWLSMKKKPLFLHFCVCVCKGREGIAFIPHGCGCHLETLRQHHGKNVLLCHQLDVCHFERMSSFFPFYKQKATNGPVPNHICPISWKPCQCFSFLFVTCLSWNYRWIMFIFSCQKQKDLIKHFPPTSNHTIPFFDTLVFLIFCRLGICSVVYEMKTTRITGHGGLKMLDYNSPDETFVYASSLPVLSHSFLWETTTLSSTGYGFFVF